MVWRSREPILHIGIHRRARADRECAVETDASGRKWRRVEVAAGRRPTHGGVLAVDPSRVAGGGLRALATRAAGVGRAFGPARSDTMQRGRRQIVEATRYASSAPSASPAPVPVMSRRVFVGAQRWGNRKSVSSEFAPSIAIAISSTPSTTIAFLVGVPARRIPPRAAITVRMAISPRYTPDIRASNGSN